MTTSLIDLIRESHHEPTIEGIEFLKDLESSLADDLWKSYGGRWSSRSIEIIRRKAMKKLAHSVQGPRREDYTRAWLEVIRDFHRTRWKEKPVSPPL